MALDPEREAYVYMIVNPKGKVYVGSTVDLKDRIYRYKTNRVKSQIKISRSIDKYGWEAYEFRLMKICKASNKLYYETYFGIKYGALGHSGLNLSCLKLEKNLEGFQRKLKRK